MFDNTWEDLIILLKGSKKSGILAANALIDIIKEEDIPFIYHELCTDVLMSSEWTTRYNGGYAIRLITQNFFKLLYPLISNNSNDGELLLLSELDIENIIKSKNIKELCSGKSNYLSEIKSENSLYDKKWLRKQRNALQRRLGLETSNIDVTNAIIYDDNIDNNLVDINDLLPNINNFKSSSLTNNSKRKRENDEVDDMIIDTNENELKSEETWLTRLVRFMIVGLLDSRWETRQGCSIGLTSIINGLFPSNDLDTEIDTEIDINNKIDLDKEIDIINKNDFDKEIDINNNSPSSSSSSPSSGNIDESTNLLYTLPSFLVEDIICSGLYVLLLDRFLDFGSSISSISPVKESAGQLIASASRYCNDTTIVVIYDKIMEMLNKEFNSSIIQYGGLVVLKYFIPIHSNFIFPSKFQLLISLLTNSILENLDDIISISTQVIKSLFYAYSKFQQKIISSTKLDTAVVEDSIFFTGLLLLIDSLQISSTQLTVLSGSIFDICNGLFYCSSMVKDYIELSIRNNQYNIDINLELTTCYHMIDGISLTMMKLHLYNIDLRYNGYVLLIKSLFLLNSSIESIMFFYNSNISIKINKIEKKSISIDLVITSARLLSSLIGEISAKPCKSLGDLFLVNKIDQKKKNSSDIFEENNNFEDNENFDNILNYNDDKSKIGSDIISKLIMNLLVLSISFLKDSFPYQYNDVIQARIISLDIISFIFNWNIKDNVSFPVAIEYHYSHIKKNNKRKVNYFKNIEEYYKATCSLILTSYYQSIYDEYIGKSIQDISNYYGLFSFCDDSNKIRLSLIISNVINYIISYQLDNANNSIQFNKASEAKRTVDKNKVKVKVIDFFNNLVVKFILGSNKIIQEENENKDKKINKPKFRFVIVSSDNNSNKLSNSTIQLKLNFPIQSLEILIMLMNQTYCNFRNDIENTNNISMIYFYIFFFKISNFF
jgi:hypothetical protein